MYPVHQGFDALDEVDALVAREGKGDLVVGSLSACHGAIAVVRVAAAGAGH